MGRGVMSGPASSRDITRAVVVMGKLPRPGRVKTRLTRALSPERAAELYRAFLGDTFRLVDRACLRPAGAPDRGWTRVFACALTEGDTLRDAEALVPDGWRVVAQAGVGLGERIEHARQAGQADHVIVMGSDSPTLPTARLMEAFAALAAEAPGTRAAVVVPTEDGGYALIAFAGGAPELLSEIPWSTENVMAATRAAAHASGVALTELAEAYDIDLPEDLSRAAADADPSRHPATYAALAST